MPRARRRRVEANNGRDGPSCESPLRSSGVAAVGCLRASVGSAKNMTRARGCARKRVAATFGDRRMDAPPFKRSNADLNMTRGGTWRGLGVQNVRGIEAKCNAGVPGCALGRLAGHLYRGA